MPTGFTLAPMGEYDGVVKGSAEYGDERVEINFLGEGATLASSGGHYIYFKLFRPRVKPGTLDDIILETKAKLKLYEEILKGPMVGEGYFLVYSALGSRYEKFIDNSIVRKVGSIWYQCLAMSQSIADIKGARAQEAIVLVWLQIMSVTGGFAHNLHVAKG